MNRVLKFPNPATTARVLARAHDSGPAKPGDLIVLCVNRRIDLWIAWPIAAVDDEGRAMTVRDKTMAEWPVLSLTVSDSCIIAPAASFEAVAFSDLHWRTFTGLQAASDAFEACYLPPGGR